MISSSFASIGTGKLCNLSQRVRKVCLLVRLEVGMIDIYYVEDDSGIAQIVKEYLESKDAKKHRQLELEIENYPFLRKEA